MKKTFLYGALILFLPSCKEEEQIQELVLEEILVGDISIPVDGTLVEDVPVDRPLNLRFSQPLDASTLTGSFRLTAGADQLDITVFLLSDQHSVTIQVAGGLAHGTVHKLEVLSSLRSVAGAAFAGAAASFKTQIGSLQVAELLFDEGQTLTSGRIQDVSVALGVTVAFNLPVEKTSFEQAVHVAGPSSPDLTFSYSENDRKVVIKSNADLIHLSKYTFVVDESASGVQGEPFAGMEQEFYTEIDPTPKFPLLSDEELLSKVQEQTFRYFWDFAHPTSGLARERNTSGNTVTSGGSGFGLMAIVVGIERGWISRQQAVERWNKTIEFLSQADRFHGAWPHWLDGETGKVIPFSSKDNGGDLVETALLVQGLLTVKAYLNRDNPVEMALSDQITQLWEEVEWDWFTKNNSGVLYWHWSPDFEWEMNLPIRGYNEALIVYILAASSPTHPIAKSTYDSGWAGNGTIKNGQSFYGHTLPLGEDFGGPLFFSQYSFLGLDPRKLSDQYANYWEQNVNHSLINQSHAVANPQGFVGYSPENWGFTASDNQTGYATHSPTHDLGVISPTAALAAFPYTPEESLEALKHFYYMMGDKIWGEYGFHDAFNITENWYADSYLAIDQGPIIIMIENYRTALLWNLFMTNQEIKVGLDRLQFEY